MRKSTVFMRCFAATLTALLAPALVFFAFCTVYENCASAYDPDATAFYIEDFRLTLFDKTCSLDALRPLGDAARAAARLVTGPLRLAYDIVAVLPKLLYNR